MAFILPYSTTLAYDTYNGGPTFEIYEVAADRMEFKVNFPQNFPSERYLLIWFGRLTTKTSNLDGWIFYPDREIDGQVGDIIDAHLTKSGVYERDDVENILNKTVSDSQVSAIRLYSTGDSSQD